MSLRDRIAILSNTYSTPIILATFVILWSGYEILAHGAGDVHNDMAEAYAWGQELQGGYFKHPPFWAWLTYAWFRVFPVEDWSAYVFTALNSALGIAFTVRCNAYFVADKRLARLAAWLLILVPAYTFLAMKMNANTIHLSVWPAIAWVFLAMMKRQSAPLGLLLGLLAACAVLSKYNAALFLTCVLAAAVVHPMARVFWRSWLPLVVVAGGLPLIALHFAWLVQNDFLPFRYFDGLRNQSEGGAVAGALKFIVAEALYAFPALLALVLIGRGAGAAFHRPAPRPMFGVLLALSVGPMLLTALFGALLQTRTPALWGLQNLFLLPALLLQYMHNADVPKFERRARGVVLAFLLVAFLLSPAIAWIKFRYGDPAAIDPRSQVARELTQWWRTTYGVPLRIVAGDESYALAATFYSPDHPSYFISRDRRLTPWITDERLKRDGALFVCNEVDEQCESEAKDASADRGEDKKISAVKEYLGLTGHNFDFSFFVIPPAGAAKP